MLNSGGSKEFNMFFGPKIGYGRIGFEYDVSKSCHFRIYAGLAAPLSDLICLIKFLELDKKSFKH